MQAADPSSHLRQRVAALVSARVLDDAPAAQRRVQTASTVDARAQQWLISDPIKHAKQQETSDYLQLVRKFITNPVDSSEEVGVRGQEETSRGRHVPSVVLKGLNGTSLDPLVLDSSQKLDDGNDEGWHLRAAGLSVKTKEHGLFAWSRELERGN